VKSRKDGKAIYLLYVYEEVGQTIKKSYIIPEQMDVDIKKLAAEERLSQSELVTKAVEEYLKRHTPKK
jgi:hypothetical protein